MFKIIKFEQAIQAIFDNLSVKELTIKEIKDGLITDAFYKILKTCQTLRQVQFLSCDDVNSQLDVIESNHNVKKLVSEIMFYEATEEVKQRIQKIISQRNDNSLFVLNKEGELDDIPQISQLFNISPVSDC